MFSFGIRHVSSRCGRNYFSNLCISPEVSQALKNGQPVVALESTIITHGMPYPTNIEMSRNVKEIIRRHGAVPATIAVLRGQVAVQHCIAVLIAVHCIAMLYSLL